MLATELRISKLATFSLSLIKVFIELNSVLILHKEMAERSEQHSIKKIEIRSELLWFTSASMFLAS